jgi:hypothetical protein
VNWNQVFGVVIAAAWVVSLIGMVWDIKHNPEHEKFDERGNYE